jgi:hypothetical protein
LLLYLGAWDTLGIFAYIQAFALLESSFILSSILILAAVLPARFLRSRFVAQGSAVVLAITFWTVLFQLIFEAAMVAWPPSQFFLWFGLALASIIVALVLVHRSWRVARVVTGLAERLTVFLYLYLPLGIMGLLVVVARNIL